MFLAEIVGCDTAPKNCVKRKQRFKVETNMSVQNYNYSLECIFQLVLCLSVCDLAVFLVVRFLFLGKYVYPYFLMVFVFICSHYRNVTDSVFVYLSILL
jgi:hypothetical protein